MHFLVTLGFFQVWRRVRFEKFFAGSTQLVEISSKTILSTPTLNIFWGTFCPRAFYRVDSPCSKELIFQRSRTMYQSSSRSDIVLFREWTHHVLIINFQEEGRYVMNFGFSKLREYFSGTKTCSFKIFFAPIDAARRDLFKNEVN